MTYKPPYRDPAILREWAADYDKRAAAYAARGMPERARICRKDAASLRDEAAEIEKELQRGHD